MSTNLLSVFKISSQGYEIELYNDKWLVKDINNNYRVPEIGKAESGLYKFQEFIGNRDVCAIAKYDYVSRLCWKYNREVNSKRGRGVNQHLKLSTLKSFTTHASHNLCI